MKVKSLKFDDYVDLDKVGIFLSLLCGLHCLLTPLMILSLPFMARYYLTHPWVHLLLAVIIIPVGLLAFAFGYRHHRQKKVFYYGFPGLLIISLAPFTVHILKWNLPEYPLMIFGSLLLIGAHWINRRACVCDAHSH